jgi:flagellin
MALVINTNVASLNAQRNLNYNTIGLQKSLERLSSGYKINRAADDAAGLQISETLRAQIRGVGQAINNAEDGNNLLSIAEGTYSVVQENLQRVRELAVQAANDTNGTAQRTAIAQEIQARLDDIDRITKATEFNGQKLLDTTTAASLRIQVGPNGVAAEDTIDIAAGTALGDATATTLGVGTVDVTTNSAALTFLATVDTALTEVSRRRSTIGALQNQLSSAILNLQLTNENLQAAESRIRNVDVASEASRLTKYQILQQAAASILSQANSSPSLALTLLGR